MVQLLQVSAMLPAWFDQCMIAPGVLCATSMRDMLFFAVFPLRSHPVACSAGVGGWMLRLLPQISLWIPDPLTLFISLSQLRCDLLCWVADFLILYQAPGLLRSL